MLRYTCFSCRYGEHRYCDGRQPPLPGTFGGHECTCDGHCAERPREPDPQLERAVEALVARHSRGIDSESVAV